jgi:hypothetical protein
MRVHTISLSTFRFSAITTELISDKHSLRKESASCSEYHYMYIIELNDLETLT